LLPGGTHDDANFAGTDFLVNADILDLYNFGEVGRTERAKPVFSGGLPSGWRLIQCLSGNNP
jgi:hypothetical protein